MVDTRLSRALAVLRPLDGPPLRFLIVEGNPAARREGIAAAGGTVAADLYRAILTRLAPVGSTCAILYPADPGGEALPPGLDWDQIDAVAGTGSALSVTEDTPAVARQLALWRSVFAQGRPCFGSCWALQVAATVAGGTVTANPRGREVGLARKIVLTPPGRDHPMYRGRAPVFDAVAIHSDEIAEPPPGLTVLAGNAVSPIQAAEVQHGRSVFWGVQYHPEFDLFEIARLMVRSAAALVGEGLFTDRTAVDRFAAEAEALAADPHRRDLAWRLGADADILDPAVRLTEMRNWIEHQVLPAAGRPPD